MEFVATVDGVRWINDSKATNVNSCWLKLPLDHRIVLPEYEGICRSHVAYDAELRVDIVLHVIIVTVQMVGRDVEHHRYVCFEVIHVFNDCKRYSGHIGDRVCRPLHRCEDGVHNRI